MYVTSKKVYLYHNLRMFLIIVITLILIGSLFIYSSSSVFALQTHGASGYFVKKQLVGLVVGIIALCIGRLLPINILKIISTPLFFASLLLLLSTQLPSFSRTIHGSSRWLSLFGITFQPSEITKIFTLFYVARFLEKKLYLTKVNWKQYTLFIVFIGFMCYGLLKQPDFGMTITLLVTIILLFFVTQKNFKYFNIFLLTFVIGTILLILTKPYRFNRILIFLNPWKDPKGAGFQIIQSLIAIGSGHWSGTGIAHSRQKFLYLPMQHTDFIFSIISEETGFIGSFFLIILFISFMYFGIRLANQLSDIFSSLVTHGFIILISLQTVMNIAVTACLIPTKGVSLPFISYGNTALVCSLFMIGIIINMVHNDSPVHNAS